VKYRNETRTALARGGCIVTCNHVSLLDGVIVALASPVPMAFAVDTEFSRQSRWGRVGLAFVAWLGGHYVVPLDSSAPFGMRKLSRMLQSGVNVTVFPEGGISLTGERGIDRPGVGWLIRQTDARVLALEIVGAEKSRWFAKRGAMIWPKINLVF